MASVCSLLDRFCEAGAITRDDCLRLNLVAEEFFTNTVRHGHGQDCDAPVWIALAATAEALSFEIEDTAPPYNPFAHQIDVDLPIEERRVGGLGVHLAREFAERAEYAYLFGRNCVRLQLARSA